MEATYTPLMMAKEAYAMQNGGRKKRGRKPVFSANQFYPWKVEMMVKDLVSSMLKENGARLKKAALVGYEADGIDEVDAEDIFVPPDFEKSAEKIFREVENFSSRKLDDFAEKTVGRTFGYIPNQAKIREDFVNNFVNNCKSAAEEEKKEIANAVYRHRMFPDGNDSLPKEINEIQKKYTKNKSNFIARNETGNLNAAIQRSQIEGAGFEMYTWMSMTDGVTRDSHRNMNGIVCRWDDPTVYSADGGKTWRQRLASMFIGQPGQDYNCRCTAVPFDPQLEDDYSVKEEPEEKQEDNDYVKNFEENLEKKSEEFAKETKRLQEKIFEETYPQTVEEKLAKAKASGLYTEKELKEMWPVFLADAANFKINKEKQNRHIVGTKEYQIIKENRNKGVGERKNRPADQCFFDSVFDPFEMYEKLVGTGILYKDGKEEVRELVKYTKDVGYAGWDSMVRTDVIGIRHSKKGGHMFPVHPNEYDKKIKKLKETKKSR